MSRGDSSGGGHSSLDYLFGCGGNQKHETGGALLKATDGNEDQKQTIHAAGISKTSANNYVRADGQNTGNFITDRTSTKVHAAPGGGSSLGYLFGNQG